MDKGDRHQEIDSFFQVQGGSLSASAPSYVVRKADQDLFESLKKGECCCVFNCRQMGKSSLRVHVIDRLRKEGVSCVTIDPQLIGVNTTEEMWYGSVIDTLIENLGLSNEIDLDEWLEQRSSLSPVRRLHEFLARELLNRIQGPIVLFVEEIDRLKRLTFVEDFFGLIRSLYEKRSTDAKYQRLSFAFIGVTTPRDLIRSKDHSPFNIGTEIELNGFQKNECKALLNGIAGIHSNPELLLDEVLDWTGGQPFLTQKLLAISLHELSDKEHPIVNTDLKVWLSRIVQTRIIDDWESHDHPEHLRTIQDRITMIEDDDRRRLINRYLRILENSSVQTNDSDDDIQLRLTGLVTKEDNRLRVYNPIYARVFNKTWAETQINSLQPRLVAEAFARWRETRSLDEEKANLGLEVSRKALNYVKVKMRVGHTRGFPKLPQRKRSRVKKRWTELVQMITKNRGHSPSTTFFLTGSGLATAEEWFKGKALTEQENKFLKECRDADARLRSSRWWKLGTGVVFVALCGMVALLISLEGSRLAERQTDIRRLVNESKRSLERGYPDEGLENAIRSVHKLSWNSDPILATEAKLNLALLTKAYRQRLCRWQGNHEDDKAVQMVAYSPRSNREVQIVASVSENRLPFLWTYQSNQNICTSITPTQQFKSKDNARSNSNTKSLAFSRDGSLLASIQNTTHHSIPESTVRVWQVSGRGTTNLLPLLELSSRRDNSRRPKTLSISSDNKFLAIGNEMQKQIQILDIVSSIDVANWSKNVTSLSFRPRQKEIQNELGVLDDQGLVSIRSVPDGKLRFPETKTIFAGRALLEFSRQGRYLAIAGNCLKKGMQDSNSEREFIYLYDLKSDKIVEIAKNSYGSFHDKGSRPESNDCTDTTWQRSTNSLTFLVNDDEIDQAAGKAAGKHLISTTRRDGSIRFWSRLSSNPSVLTRSDFIQAGKGRDNLSSSNVRVSPDGNFFTSTDLRNRISLRRVNWSPSGSSSTSNKTPKSFYILQTPHLPSDAVITMAFSKDAKNLAVSYSRYDKGLQIYRLPDRVSDQKDDHNIFLEPDTSLPLEKLPLTNWEFENATLRISDDRSEKVARRFKKYFKNHGKPTDDIELASFSNKRLRFVMGPYLTDPGKIDLPLTLYLSDPLSKLEATPRKPSPIHLQSPDVLDRPLAQFEAVTLSNDGSLLMASTQDGSIGIWSIPSLGSKDTKKLHQTLEFIPVSVDREPLKAIAISSVKAGGDSWFAIAESTNTISLFRLAQNLKDQACELLVGTYKASDPQRDPRPHRRFEELKSEGICKDPN